MTTVTSADGTRIAFHRIGDGPAVILVDGAMCYRGSGPGDALAAELARRFTVYTYDRRGRGESGDAADYAVEREIDDLAALIAHAGGPARVFGHSSGAVLALETSLREPGVVALALFEPPPVGNGEEAELSRRLAELIRQDRRGDAVEAFQTAIGLPPQMVTGMRGTPMRAALEAIAPTLVYDTAITSAAALDRYAAVTVPTLLVDSLASPETLRVATAATAKAVPGAAHRSLPGGFHDVGPALLAPVLTEFFGQAG